MIYDFVFRFDANLNVGAGHLQRAISLIQPIIEKGLTVACLGEYSHYYRMLLKGEREGEGLDCFDIDKHLSSRCLVVDHYAELDCLLDSVDFQSLVVFADQDNVCHSRPDLVISAFGDPDSLRMNFPNASVFTGIEYLSFRREVDRLAEQYRSRVINQTSEDSLKYRVLVSLGGSNQDEYLKRICLSLEPLQKDIDLEVISPNFVDLPQGPTLTVGLDPEFLTKAFQMNLVICGLGQTYLELSKIGVETIGLVLAENQLSCAKYLSLQGGDIIHEPDDLEEILPDRVKAHMLGTHSIGSNLPNVISAKSHQLVDNLIKLLT